MANKKINDGITAEVMPKTNLTVEPKGARVHPAGR